MMKSLLQLLARLGFLGWLLVLAGTVRAQVPQMIHFQGRVTVGGAPFTGAGQFKFALVNGAGTPTYWSNDGTSVGGSEPTAAVSLTVAQGVYTVLLGDATLPNMTAIANAVFANSDVRLRVWFNDGVHGSQLLTPDQRLVAVGYAMVAGTAGTVADGAITAGKIAPGAVGSAALAPGLTLGGTTTGNFSGPLAGNAATATTAGSAASFTGPLAGNVTGTQGATVVATVGGVTAANVASGANLANAATAANTANTIVRRNASGNFTAGTITATAFIGSGAGLTGLSPANLSAGLAGINISGNAATATTAATAAVAESVSIPPGMAYIPGGAFTMGRTSGDSDADAVPISVTVSAFYMDVNEVSWSQWQSVYYWAKDHGYTDLTTGAGKAANHPVQTLNWYDCVKWCNARSEQAGKPAVYFTDAGLTAVYRTGEVPVFAKWAAKGYRLPTEAEWEKAARGGLSGQRFPWGDKIDQNLANYYGATASYAYDLGPNGYNAIGSVGGTWPATSPVGSFAANGYGLNDMAGNVWEWCWDRYGTSYEGGTDPRGPASGPYRVLRGGCWFDQASVCRSADRYYNPAEFRRNTFGFRSALPPGQP